MVRMRSVDDASSARMALPVRLRKAAFEGVGLGLGFEFVAAADGDDFSAIDDGNAIGDAVGLFHIVSGQEDGGASSSRLRGFDVLPEVEPRVCGIEAECGLVEKDDLRMVEQPAGDLEPSFHAAGELFDEAFFAIAEVDESEELFDAGAALAGRHAIEDAVEFHIFPGGEFVIEGGVLENDAEGFADGGGVGGGVVAIDDERAGGGAEEGGEHFDGGGFAGAVGAEKGEAFAAGDIEGDVIDGGEVAEFFGEVLHPDWRGCVWCGDGGRITEVGRSQGLRVSKVWRSGGGLYEERRVVERGGMRDVSVPRSRGRTWGAGLWRWRGWWRRGSGGGRVSSRRRSRCRCGGW